MRFLVAALLGGALLVSPVLAQAPSAQTPNGKAPGTQAPSAKPPAKAPAVKAPEYDPSAEVTISGILEDYHESKLRSDHPGLHLMVKTETETIEVHACPARFMADLDLKLEKGDAIKVVGSRPGGAGVMVAREVTKGQLSLELRDKKGIPNW
jgi:hypothetical protein